MFRKAHLLLAGALLAGACATPPRFEYGAYEPTLYAYYKKPELAEKFETALEKAIQRGEASDRLAPGLYAELGYLRLEQGDQRAAIEMFNKEAAAFPESAFFMKSIVARLNGEELAKAEIAEASDAPGTDVPAEPGAAAPVQASEPELAEGA